MANKDSDKKPVVHPDGASASSAPELPHDVAKQYGLHHLVPAKTASPPAPLTDPTQTTSGEKAAPVFHAVAPAESGDDGAKSAEKSDADEVINDSKTDAAVDDILAKESDQLLGMERGAVPQFAPAAKPGKRGFWGSIGHFFVRWYKNPWTRWLTILIILALIGVFLAVPKVRYKVLNTAGVRSSASVIVLDNTTQLPLKNVTVTLGSQKELTDHDGVAKFSNLKLGDYQLTIKRIAFASYTEHVTIGWGSNPLGSYKIKATGLQYTINVSDFVTGGAIAGAEATNDEAVAESDKTGKIILTVADTSETKISVTVSAAGYRSEPVSLDASQNVDAKVVLVPTAKDVFVSKQSGKYDVYSTDLDGANRKLVLAGTGNENSNISLVVSPDGTRAALVSTRDSIHDNDGFLLQALTIINLETNTSVTVDHAEQIQLVDWQSNRLIYRMTLAGASAADSQRSRLISYNYDSNARLQLATANQFNAIMSVGGYLYYTVSSTDPHATLGLFRIKADGSSRQQLSHDEIWTGMRSTYNTLSLQTPSGWNTYNVQSGQISNSSAPPNLTSYLFTENSQADHSAWIDVRDGNGTLLLHDDAKNTDKTLQSQNGIAYPVRWATDNALLYRIANDSETADYVIGPNGSTPHKISDVTPTYGYAQIY